MFIRYNYQTKSMKRFKTVDEYINASGEWKECLQLFRELFGTTELFEEVKWGMPVYTLNGKNVAGFSAFKSFSGIWFYQGVFLSDPEKKLINAQEGVTKAMRQWRFTSIEEIRDSGDTIKAYLEEAIRNQKEGKEVKPERNKPLEIPDELRAATDSDPSLRDSFHALSPGKQREYAEHVAGAKRADTRTERLKKIIPMILEGVGLNDKYKKQ